MNMTRMMAIFEKDLKEFMKNIVKERKFEK